MGKWGFAFLLFCYANLASAAPVFGRYIGTLEHSALKKEQLAKLDFISSREENNTLFLKAMLTLYLGDFASKEYVTYHFDDVRFNLLTQSFVFSQADQPVTLVIREFSGNRMVGEFRSAYAGEISKMVLSEDDGTKSVVPKLPLIQPVWGEYRGVCNSPLGQLKTAVQLYTYRSTVGMGEEGNPFRAYNIKGLIGEVGNPRCLDTSELCTWGNISKGSYNFYKNRLIAFSRFMNLECSAVDGGIDCNQCGKLTRVSKEWEGERRLSPIVFADAFEKTEPGAVVNGELEGIQGEYTGYVHHEYLNRYHRGGLNILTYQAAPEPGSPPTLRMSALATLYFGETSSIEAIPYKFDERSYPNPLLQTQFVLSQADRDVDAILQITSIGKGIVRGVWFSRAFGRVGKFEFRKSGDVAIPKESKLMEKVSGLFESSLWNFNLGIGLGTGAPGSEDPFAPLTFQGWAIIPDLTARIELTGGSYDFYTGRIGIEFGEKGSFVGDRPSRSRMYLKKLSTSVSSPMSAHTLVPYRLVEDR